MKKIIIYIVFHVLICGHSFGIQKTINHKHDTLIINEWIAAGKKLRTAGKLDSAKIYFEKAYQLSGQLKYEPGCGQALFYQALICADQGNYALALKNHDMAIAIMKKRGDKKHLASNYNAKGVLLQKQGKFTDALRLLYKALKIREELNDSMGMGSTLGNIGSVYDEQKNFDMALKKHFQAIAIKKAIGNTAGLAICYSNVCGVYVMQEKYEEAMKYQMMALEIDQKAGNQRGIATGFTNLGYIYNSMSDYKNALKFHFKGLALKEEAGSKGGILSSLVNIGCIYASTGPYSLSEKYLLKALNLANEIDELDMKMDINKYLSGIYEKSNQTAKAYKHFKQYIFFRDSIINMETVRENERIALNYEFEKKELHQKNIQEKKDVLVSEKAKIKELELSRSRYMIVGLASIIIVVIVITLFLMKQSRFKAQQESMHLEQQLLRSQMNPHFVFNSINSIQRYILQKDQQQAYDYLAKFAKLIRMVLNNSIEKALPLRQELEMIKLYVELEQLRFDNTFDFNIIMDDNIDEDVLNVPCMLIQPYVENAIWHGLMNLDNGKKGVLTINMHLNNDRLQIIILDNGIGRELAKTYKTENSNRSIGMKLIEQRLQIINKMQDYEKAKVCISDLSDELGKASGTKVEIFIPVS